MEWAFRCKVENAYAKTGAFITLTYDEEKVPWKDTKEGTYQTLNKVDFQQFMKRLRYYSGEKLRYFACGEYGPDTLRPHYHALVWNLEKSVKNQVPGIWKHGFTKVGSIEEKSIKYVTNYMMKKPIMNPPGTEPYFTVMSRRPGIGYQYAEKNQHRHEFSEDYRLLLPMMPEKRPFMSNYYMRRMNLSEQVKEDIRKEKEKAYEEFMSGFDSMNPFGELAEYKRMKQEQAERRKKFFNKNLTKI